MEVNFMRKYEVIEDNGGGLTLVVFNNNGIVDYLHSGYEYGTSGRLMDDIQALKNGDNPATDWDGNEDNPQAVYDNIVSFEYGWEIVADNDGIYPDKMGCAACLEFGIEME
jgi:hypothetical protein